MNGLGVAEIAEHYAKIVSSLEEQPILMGHSFGGLIVQLLMDKGLGAAGVSIDGVALKGVLRLPFAALRSASAVLANPLNHLRTVMLSLSEFKYAFANTMPSGAARDAYDRYAIPGPGRPIFQAAFANLDPWSPTKVNRRNHDRAPLLLIAGLEDHQVPASMNREDFNRWQHSASLTDYKEFPLRSHLILAQDGWEEVADYAITWAERSISRTRVKLPDLIEELGYIRSA
jgi:pimeloyl-ACP methyl ester carboxylesterase